MIYLNIGKTRQYHELFESHLPYLVSIAFVDKIIIPKDIYDTLTLEISLLKNTFPNFDHECLIITSPRSKQTKLEELTEKSFEFFETTPIIKPRKGFSLSIDSNHRQEIFLPLILKNNEINHIHFKAKGRNFFIILSNIKISSETKKDITIHIQEESASISLGNTVDTKLPLAKMDNFNQGCDNELSIGYHIEYDGLKGTIFIERFVSASFYDRKILKLENKEIPKDLKFVSLLVVKKIVSFQEIDIK